MIDTTSTASATSPAVAASTNSNALTTLSGNFSSFLQLLMAQLQNQDPTSPMDTNQFTQELVQYSQVEQQINTNSDLTQLIQLTQGNSILQSSALVGKTVDVQSDHLSLQSGAARLQFSGKDPASVAVGIFNGAGLKVRDATVDTTANGGTWTWDGADNAGRKLPDGSYKVAVTNAAGGTISAPFDVVATATGLTRSGNDLQLQLGSLSVDFSAVQSVVQGQ